MLTQEAMAASRAFTPSHGLVTKAKCFNDTDGPARPPAELAVTTAAFNDSEIDLGASDAMYLKVTVEEVGPVNELDMSVGLDARMELSWPFKTFSCSGIFRLMRHLKNVRHEEGGLRVIGSPITFATYRGLAAQTRLPEVVVREARLVQSASDNFEDKDLVFTMDSASNGKRCSVTYSARQTTILDCPMDFSNYPREIHECSISITITSFPENVTKFLWSRQSPIKVNPNVGLVRFEATVLGPGRSNDDLTLKLRLARRMGDQLVGTYAPTALLVVCSWPAFWLGTVERLSLGGTLLLALTQQSAAARRALPPSVALTPVDWWMSGCVALVLAVIVETTVACYEDKILPVAWRVHRVMPREVGTSDRPAHTEHLLRRLVSVARPTGRMDAVACLLFPVAFVLFNACYWATIFGG